MRRFVKSVVFLVVSAVTWMISSSLRAQIRPDVPEPQVHLSQWVPGQPLYGPGQVVGSRPVDAEMSFRESRVVFQGNTAQVAVTAAIEDRLQLTHLWRLHLEDENQRVISDKIYWDQAFQVGPAQTLNPTFQEQVELPENARQVVVSLYSYKAGVNPPDFASETAANHQLSVRCKKVVPR